jgi:hypothetical protein
LAAIFRCVVFAGRSPSDQGKRAMGFDPARLPLAKARNAAKIEVADLFAQGVAVQSKNFSGFDLIAARPGQRGGDQE